MDNINILKSFPSQKDSPKTLEHATVVPANKRAPTLDDGHTTKIGGMWTLKHDIRLPKFYKLLIKK